MFDNDEHEKQQAFIDYKKPAINAAEQPNYRLHQTDSKKIIQLIPTDTANRNSYPAMRIRHAAKLTSQSKVFHFVTSKRVVPTEHLSVESQLPWYEKADNLPRKRTEDDSELIEEWASAGLTHEGKPL